MKVGKKVGTKVGMKIGRRQVWINFYAVEFSSSYVCIIFIKQIIVQNDDLWKRSLQTNQRAGDHIKIVHMYIHRIMLSNHGRRSQINVIDSPRGMSCKQTDYVQFMARVSWPDLCQWTNHRSRNGPHKRRWAIHWLVVT